MIPASWKHSDIVFIPKRGKPVSKGNLRPIYFPSFVGKLLERTVLARLEWYMGHHFPVSYTQTRFRQNISTQNTLIRISHDLYEFPSSSELHGLLALNLHLGGIRYSFTRGNAR